MDYQLIIFLSRKELMAVDITEDGDCEDVSIDGNATMKYASVDDFVDFKQYICDAYNVDEIEEMEAGTTIVNCGADAEASVALQEELKGFKGIDSIDVKKLLPIIAQNKGLLQKGGKTVFNVMGNCFVVKCDDYGVAKVSKNKVTDSAVELAGADFGFLYFYKGESSGVSEEEMANVKQEADDRVAAAKQAAEAEIAAVEAKYANIVREHAEYKKIVDAIEDKKKENSGKFANVNMGDIVKFGRYYQDSDETMEDIEWEVLEVKSSKILVISKKGLDVQSFAHSCNEWEKSYIRRWLNGVFLKKAFRDEENSMIFEHESEEGCKDKVFLLSGNEARNYFPNDKYMQCQPTQYSKTKGAYVKDNCCDWWLRSPGCQSYETELVGTNGKISTFNHRVSDCSITVRPALWISIEN